MLQMIKVSAAEIVNKLELVTEGKWNQNLGPASFRYYNKILTKEKINP